MGNKIIEHINSLKDKAACFTTCFEQLNKEESETNQAEIIEAWKLILRKFLNEIHSLLISLKEEIAWSMLDERREFFLETQTTLTPSLTSFKDYEDEENRSVINKTILLLDDGKNGFRQSFIGDDYYEKLFDIELNHYREENEVRLENIYQIDSQEQAINYSDETQLKNAMLTDSRKQLFETRFGKIYHDQGRSIKVVTALIIEAHEKDYNDINDFLGKYLAYQIAIEHCETKNETVFKQHIFKENVDVDKVMKMLDELIKDKTIGAQKHWFIVYKVFATKKWLKKNTQTFFIDYMNSVFYHTLKCSSDDFKKIESYFKKTDYAEWSLEDPTAPSCCDKYKQVADALDREFEEPKYAKPNTRINTRKIEKFR